MTIKAGDKLPDADLVEATRDGPAVVALSARLAGKRVAIFGLPGAFTGTCSTAHMPSFIRSMDGFRDKGVDEVICVAVNDPFVMGAWGEQTGAFDAGITMLCDAESKLTEALGLRFDAAPAGLIGRSRRYAMMVEDGVATVVNLEESPGTCEISAGETLLAAI